MWDHPVSSASISRDYTRTLLERHDNKVTHRIVAHTHLSSADATFANEH